MGILGFHRTLVSYEVVVVKDARDPLPHHDRVRRSYHRKSLRTRRSCRLRIVRCGLLCRPKNYEVRPRQAGHSCPELRRLIASR